MRNANDRNQYKADASAEENRSRRESLQIRQTLPNNVSLTSNRQNGFQSSILEERLSARFKSIHSTNELYRDVTSSDN